MSIDPLVNPELQHGICLSVSDSFVALPLFSKGNKSRSSAWSAKTSGSDGSKRKAKEGAPATRSESQSWRRRTQGSSETSRPWRNRLRAQCLYRRLLPCGRFTASLPRVSVAVSPAVKTGIPVPGGPLRSTSIGPWSTSCANVRTVKAPWESLAANIPGLSKTSLRCSPR